MAKALTSISLMWNTIYRLVNPLKYARDMATIKVQRLGCTMDMYIARLRIFSQENSAREQNTECLRQLENLLSSNAALKFSLENKSGVEYEHIKSKAKLELVRLAFLSRNGLPNLDELIELYGEEETAQMNRLIAAAERELKVSEDVYDIFRKKS